MVTIDQLKKIMPQAGLRAEVFYSALNDAMAEFGINTPARQAAFLAQLAHETGQLTSLVENLNYSAEGLANTWPTRYAKKDGFGHYLVAGGRKVPNELALNLHRLPEKIANNVYANRMGNGDEASGDGWRYRGSGGFQITGKDNQRACAEHFGIPLEKVGEWLRSPVGACRSSGWFWQRAGCNELADRGNVDAISDRINIGRDTAAVGDAIGYKDRLAFFETAERALA
jgi:putative chitinase